MPVANAQEYAVLINESRVNSLQPLMDFASLVPDWDKIESGIWKGTDWLDELIVEDAPMQNHALNVVGGGKIPLILWAFLMPIRKVFLGVLLILNTTVILSD